MTAMIAILFAVAFLLCVLLAANKAKRDAPLQVSVETLSSVEARWSSGYGGEVPRALLELYATELAQQAYIAIDGHRIDAFLSPEAARGEAHRRGLPAHVVPFAVALEPVSTLYVIEVQPGAADGTVRVWDRHGGGEVFPSLAIMRRGMVHRFSDRTI